MDGMDGLSILAVLLVVVLLTALAAYNGLMSLRQDVRAAWAAMDVQLHKRYALIPPLASAARGPDASAPPGLAAAVAAKNRAAVAFNPAQLASAEADLTAGLHALFASPPPGTVGTPAFDRARAELAAAEATIATAARTYNAAVADYNAALRSFPMDWAALLFGFRPQPPLTVDPLS